MNEPKTAEQRVLDDSAWSDFCDALKEAGQLVEAELAPQNAFDRAEGYRYLSRMLRAGLESFLEAGDPLFPELRCPAHETIKLGADNPDNHYQTASIDPNHDYRITGTRGTVDYLGFGTRIERIGAEQERPAPLTPEKLDRALQGAVQFMRNTTGLFEDWAESFLPTVNQVAPADQAFCQAIGGDPNIYYFHSSWELAEDEALLIHAPEVPACQTWNFVLQNWWMESLDYRYHQIHFNKHTARYEADGSVVIVVAHRKPPQANWVETAGHQRGTLCWRWIGASEHPPVQARVVKFSELDSV